MARTKNTRRKPKKTDNPTSQDIQETRTSGEEDVEIQRAEQLLISADFDAAKQICALILQSHPLHLKALETLALCELELGDVTSARKLLHKCLNHSKPNTEPTVHLYLAQLSGSPTEALSHYTSALDTLKSKLNQILHAKNPNQNNDDPQSNELNPENKPSLAPTMPDNPDPVATVHWSIDESQIRRSCSRALVAMTEIYLTDLCFEESAEEKCLEYLAMASSLDPTDPEPLLTLASVRLSQKEQVLAKEALMLSWSLWRNKPSGRKLKADGAEEQENANPDQDQIPNIDMNERDGALEAVEKEYQKMDLIDIKMVIEEEVMIEEEHEEQSDDNILPPIESRINWAKLAIECEMWNSAIEVLQQCEAEDDEDGEIQYLLAVTWFLMGESRATNPDSKPLDPPASHPISDSIAVGDGLGQIECWLQAQEAIESCLQLHEKLGESSGVDQSILDHLEEMKKECAQLGLTPLEVQDDDDEKAECDESQINDDEWVDASDVEMG